MNCWQEQYTNTRYLFSRCRLTSLQGGHGKLADSPCETMLSRIAMGRLRQRSDLSRDSDSGILRISGRTKKHSTRAMATSVLYGRSGRGSGNLRSRLGGPLRLELHLKMARVRACVGAGMRGCVRAWVPGGPGWLGGWVPGGPGWLGGWVSVSAWARGCVGAWVCVCGCVGAWVCGCVGACVRACVPGTIQRHTIHGSAIQGWRTIHDRPSFRYVGTILPCNARPRTPSAAGALCARSHVLYRPCTYAHACPGCNMTPVGRAAVGLGFRVEGLGLFYFPAARPPDCPAARLPGRPATHPAARMIG